MTKREFQEIFIEASSEVADRFYPKGKSSRRGEYLRDQGVLCVELMNRLGDLLEP
jgi:hypothetical protein